MIVTIIIRSPLLTHSALRATRRNDLFASDCKCHEFTTSVRIFSSLLLVRFSSLFFFLRIYFPNSLVLVGLGMQGFLFGLGATIVVVIGGILATFGAPGAMFDALLAPFSSERWRRHLQYKIDRYFGGLTKSKSQILLSLSSVDCEILRGVSMLTHSISTSRTFAIAVEDRFAHRLSP